jgi:hypothetical protein
MRVSDVPIRGGPPEHVEQRRAALTAAAARLHGRAPVSEADRQAVLDAVDAAHSERDDRLTERPRL